MAYVFDTLGYSKHLQGAGVSRDHADAHAEAVKSFVMADIVTKADLQQGLDNLALKLTIAQTGIIVAALSAFGLIQRLIG